MRRLFGLGSLALLGGLLGCGEGAVVGDSLRNSPPNTEVTATPPVLTASGFSVSFNWTGSDADGEIEGFEWRISNNGADGIVDVQDTVEVNLPWSFTTVTDSTFMVQADLDSFPPDSTDPRQRPRDFRFWQTHTFFVRAVDEKGGKDPSPANVSFTATTLAPTAQIDIPAATIPPDCIQGPRVLTFGWTATDPDLVTGDPEYIRYLLKPYSSATGGCITVSEFRILQPIRNDDPLWSEWIRYDALEDSGKIVTFDKQDAGSIFLFAVQARDIAGAVTPTFEWGVNVRHVQTTNSKYPLLTVVEQFLGTESAVSTGTVRQRDIAEDQELKFSWVADAADYAGLIEAYRYGWDVADPEDPNDPGWAVPWGNGAAWRRAPTQRFQQGAHTFVVQCRDNSGTISRLIYILNVIQVPALSEQRELVLIDDWKEDQVAQLDPLWDSIWNQLLQGVTNFQPADVLEASVERARITFAFMVDYKSAIWFTNASSQSVWATQFSPITRLVSQFNWMEIYQAKVGNLLMVGPGSLGNTIEQNEAYVFPIVFNVPANPPLGLGTYPDIDGTRKNRGTLRYPYRSYCLEMIDQVRPPLGRVFGENDAPGVQVRSVNCDGLHTAELDTNFAKLFPETTTVFGMGTLRPNSVRVANTPGYQFQVEEFYNQNTTARTVAALPRPCQVTMYRWRTRRGMGAGPPNPTVNCLPRDRDRSALENVPCGIASQVYSDSKPINGASDFVWGFHPMGFQTADIQRSLRWIMKSNWALDVQ